MNDLVRGVESLLLVALALLAPLEVIGEEQKLTFQEIATGIWGFEVAGASCDDNPHEIAFSENGRFMFLQYAKGADGEPPPVTKYRLLGEGPGFQRMAVEGETRTTSEGALVEWDLMLLDPDSYCWHRTDWQEGGCTQPARRCSEDAEAAM